jgi:fluoride exporter
LKKNLNWRENVGNLLAVAAGGALGAVARYKVSEAVYLQWGKNFPWGTFTVNIAGSLIIGISWFVIDHADVTAGMKAFLITGLLGAFTTFSTYSYETLLLLKDGNYIRALIYVVTSTGAGILMAYLGWTVSRTILG